MRRICISWRRSQSICRPPPDRNMSAVQIQPTPVLPDSSLQKLQSCLTICTHQLVPSRMTTQSLVGYSVRESNDGDGRSSLPIPGKSRFAVRGRMMSAFP